MSKYVILFAVTKRKAESTAAPPAPVKRKKIIVTPVDFDFQPETTTTTLAVDVHRPYGGWFGLYTTLEL